MKKFTKLLFLLFLSVTVFTGCEEEADIDPLNFITFADPGVESNNSMTTYRTGVDVNSTATVTVPVYISNVSGADRTFSLVVDTAASTGDPSSYSVPASITIPANQNSADMTVTLSDSNLGIGVNTVVIGFANEAGLSRGDQVTISYSQNCTEIDATLVINFDGYGSEVSWEVTDALGGVTASGGPYADGQATASEMFKLCSGRDYTFTIFDSFGDGLSFPANGDYTLTVGGAVKATGGGDYGSSDATNFDTN